MKRNWIFIVLNFIIAVCLITSCAPQVAQPTGKGNGGNGLPMSVKEIKSRLESIKPDLMVVFEALQNMWESEKLVKGSTDLSEFPELFHLFSLMFKTDKEDSIFSDIETPNNLEISESACMDNKNVASLGVAVAGEIHGQVCLSISEIRKISQKGADTAVDISVIALGAHEFGHHYLGSPTSTEGEQEENEKTLQALQAFVSYQLHKFDGTEIDGLVSISGKPMLDKFLTSSKEKLEQIKEASTQTQEVMP